MSTTATHTVNSKAATRIIRLGAMAILLGGAAVASIAVSPLAAEPGTSVEQALRFDDSAVFKSDGRSDVRKAVATFIDGMKDGDVQTVWLYASEEDQAAFGTERAVYDAFAEVLPALAQAEEVTFERGWQEGDTPFVELSVRDTRRQDYDAEIGLWLDDAGDWKIVSAEVTPANDFVASR